MKTRVTVAAVGFVFLIAGFVTGVRLWNSFVDAQHVRDWDSTGYHESGDVHGRLYFGHGPINAKAPPDSRLVVEYPPRPSDLTNMRRANVDIDRKYSGTPAGYFSHLEFWPAEGSWLDDGTAAQKIRALAIVRGSFFWGCVPPTIFAIGLSLIAVAAERLGRIRAVLTVIFLFLIAVTITLWIRSVGRYSPRDVVARVSLAKVSIHETSAAVMRGGILFSSGSVWGDGGGVPHGWCFDRDRVFIPRVHGSFLGFSHFHYGNHTGYTSADGTGTTIPLWALLILFAIQPTFFVRHSLTVLRRSPRAGLCPTCGYDLRASGERCPECGNSVGGATGATRTSSSTDFASAPPPR